MVAKRFTDVEKLLANFANDEGEQALSDDVLAGIMADETQATLGIWRLQNDRDKTGAFINTFHPADFSLEEFRNNYGGGIFRMRLTNALGHLVRNKVIKIEENKSEPTAKAGNDLSAIIEHLAQMQKDTRQEMRELVLELKHNAAPAPQGPSMMEMLALMQNQQNQSMQTLVQLLGIMKPNHAPTGDPVKALLEGLQLGREMSGNAPQETKETSALDILKSGLETLGPIAGAVMAGRNQQNQQRQPMQQRPPMPPLPVIHQEAPAQQPIIIQPEQQEPQSMNFIEMSKLKMALNYLCDQAANNADAGLYAELAMDNLTPEQINDLILPDSFMVTLGDVCPRVKEFPEWFATLRNAAIEMIQEAMREQELTPLQNVDTSGGNTTNTFDNGTII